VDPLLGATRALAASGGGAASAAACRLISMASFKHAARGFWAFHHLLENGPLLAYVIGFHVEHCH